MSQRTIQILFICLSLWTIVPLSIAETLHTIVIADTSNWQGGTSFSKDLSRIKELAGTIAIYTRLKLRLYEISGHDLNRNKVTATLDALSVEQNDVVLFHYAGHGGRTSNKSTLWPFMDIDGGALDLDKVKSILEQKNPRFLVILADTCNNFNDSLNPVWSRGGSSRGTTPQSESYRRLFLNYRGHVFASGAKPGQSSWGNSEHGGFFTDAFIKNLNNELASSNPNWHSIMKRTEAPIEVGGKVQNPQFKVNIQPAREGVVQPTEDACYYFYKPEGVLCCRSSRGTTCEASALQSESACPEGGLLMKPGGVLCCRRSTEITCQ
ncbi:MAG: hypothetical protein BWK78_07305 [Thiotrichaceae bacterium IS1]|nr:MAG: hypothetical protein BWK78_07305 [Thiotrichaceae bacterium IS1]